MRKLFRHLILLIIITGVNTVFAQKEGKKTPRKVITVQGDSNRSAPPPPPPAPLIYKAPEKSDFKDFVSEDGTFQITFPGVPKLTKQELENGILTNYRVYRQGSNSIVNTIDFIFDVETNKEKIYENYKINLLKTPKTTVEAERDFQIEGKTGKEFDVRLDFYYQKIRIFVVGTRVYEIKSDATNWHIINDATKKQFFSETDRFFNSFKSLKTPEKVVLAAPESFLGEAKDGFYKNTFFNFSFNFPKEWYLLNEAETNTAKIMGLDALKTEREKVNRAFAEATQKETLIFGIRRGIPGSGENSNLLIGVLKQPSKEATAEAVAITTRNFFLTNPKIKLAEDVRIIRSNGTTFATFTIETGFDAGKVNQKIFITIRESYSVSFVLTYLNSEELKALLKITESIKFDEKMK